MTINMQFGFLCVVVFATQLITLANGEQEVAGAEPRCRSGWTLYRKFCYFFSNIETTWPDAVSICGAFGASLVKVQNNDEHLFLKRQIGRSGPDYWIGFVDLVQEGQWEWVSINQWPFRAWAGGMPDGGVGTDCVQMWSGNAYLWDDVGCLDMNRFICEKRLVD